MRRQARAFLLASALTAASSWAQPTAAPVAAPAPGAPAVAIAEEEETVMLSPFEVTASSALGYQETETLAGTRIRTSLEDVGSAISVVNQQFLQDTGATSNQTLLLYTTNTEVGGTGGNFGGLGDLSVLDDTAQRLQPNNSTRVRGLDSADNTRDFYLTDIPWDSYNTSRIDIQRGANSVLFGNGSGAGIINGAPDSASLTKNSGTIEARYGSYGSYRGSLNINRILLEDQLAVRFAVLHDKKFFQQDPAYSRDQRYYGAVRLEPAFLKRARARTSLRLSYEHGEVNSNRPRTSTPVDEISPWFRTGSDVTMVSPTPTNAAGNTTLGVIQAMKWRTRTTPFQGYDPFVAGVNNAALITANPGRPDIGARSSTTANFEPWISFGSNNGVNGDWQGSPAAIFEDPNSSVMTHYLAPSIANQWQYFGLNSAGVRDGTVTGLRNPGFDGIVKFDDYASTSGFRYQASGIYRAASLANPQMFDFFHNLIDGPNKREFSKFNAVNVSLDQTFFDDKAGFQLALDHQNYDWGQSNQLGGSPILSLDIWGWLPVALPDSTGQLQAVRNPNFGRPFTVSGRGTFVKNTNKRDVTRFTPYAEIDFKDILRSENLATSILGVHHLTGLMEHSELVEHRVSGPHNALTQAQAAALLGPTNLTITGSNQKIVVVSYLGSSVMNAGVATAPAGLSAITAVQQPTNGPLLSFNSNYRPGAPSAALPYTPPALGISPSATGGAATTQSENPANYIGWTATTPINVNNADLDGLIPTSASRTLRKTNSWALVDQWSMLDNNVVLMMGVRKDKVSTRYATGTGGVPSSYGVVTNTFGGFPEAPSIATYTSELLKTYSVVLKTPKSIRDRLPWGLSANVFYSQSDNFRPVNRIDIFGNDLPPPSGTTKDYGVLLQALAGKVSLKVNHYETKTFGAGGDVNDNFGNNMRQRIGDEIRHAIQDAYYIKLHVASGGYRQNNPFDPTGLYAVTPVLHADGSLITSSSPATQADWVATEQKIQAAAQDALDKSLPGGSKALPGTAAMLSTYRFNPSSNFASWTPGTALDFSFPSTLTITSDTVSEGWEYELYLRPTRNWNITLNASKTFATRVNLSAAVKDWVKGRWDLYTNPSNPALQSIGDIPWFGGSQGDNAGRINTNGLARFGRNAWAFFNLESAQEGNAVPELRPWRLNLVNTYNFSAGRLKGTFVGGSYRWQDADIIGYGVTEISPQLSAQTPAVGVLDPLKPFHGPSQSAVDLWIGYNRKLTDEIDWRIQLNVTNAFGKNKLQPVNTNPDGSIGSWRISDGTSWQVTSSFKF